MNPRDQQDAPIWQALELSALGRLATAILTLFVTAASTSRAMAARRHWHDQWHALPAPERTQAVGALMIVASLVHIGVAALRQPVGFWWLIVPGTALAFGFTAIVLSRLGGSSR